MKSLQQIRAAHAWPRAEHLTAAEVNGVPPLIINNGLLAAAAFASASKDNGEPKRPAMKAAFDAVADHLANVGILSDECRTLVDLLEELPNSNDALPLQRATVESLAYLTYLKRFARAKRPVN